MKKVWILEKFETSEDMENSLIEMMEKQLKHKDDKEYVALLEQLIQKICEHIQETPEGYWYGFAGKTIYKQFCEEATSTIRMNKGKKFRVVEAEIKDTANTWIGYNFVKENEDVLRYLYATM